MIKYLLVILTFFISSIKAQDDFKKISAISVNALKSDKQAITELYKESLKKENSVLYKYLIESVSLLMLKSGSKSTSDYLQKVKALYPNENVLAFLEKPPLVHECQKCQGFAKILNDCRRCKKGECRNCKGEGVISYGSGKSKKENPCIACKSTGHCKDCKGTEKIPGKCVSCRGKGLIFDRKIFAAESKRLLTLLKHKAAELDGDSGTEFDKSILEEDAKIRQQGDEFLEAKKTKAAEWLELEKKRFAAVKKRKKDKNSNFITMEETEVVETYEEGGSTSTLNQICLEITEYMKGQERKAKQSILNKVYGQFLSDVPTVHVVVSDEFIKASYDYKQRAADGFFRFSLLRAERNGYDSIAFKLLDSAGNQIGVSTEKGFVFKK